MSIATEIARLTGLRDRIRTKLVDLGLAEANADLEDCAGAVEEFAWPSGLVLAGTAQLSYGSKSKNSPYVVEKTINIDPQYKNYIAICAGYWIYTYTRSGVSTTIRTELMGVSLLGETGNAIIKLGSPTVNTTVSDGSFTAMASASLAYDSYGTFLLRVYGVTTGE